jgi:beta-galactosidase
LTATADTYFDMSGYKKGMVWVNGHNLGRYWYVGPQQRLYCPASWLKKGKNTMIVLDLHQQAAATVKGRRTLDNE